MGTFSVLLTSTWFLSKYMTSSVSRRCRFVNLAGTAFGLSTRRSKSDERQLLAEEQRPLCILTRVQSESFRIWWLMWSERPRQERR